MLGATGADRPVFDASIGTELRREMEAGLAPLVENLADDEKLTVSKHLLSRVHGCQVRLLAEESGPDDFVATVPIARGTVAHKAIELGIHSSPCRWSWSTRRWPA